jgi:hypothetical protein
MFRSLGLLMAFGALSGCFINGNGQAQGDAKDNGNGNASNNGNGNGSGNGSNNGNGTNPPLDGTKPSDGAWDITTATGSPIGPSQFVLAGSTATGFIANPTEGRPDGSLPFCTITKDRSEFHLTASGNTLTGTFTVLTFWSGDSCPQNQSRVINVAGTRSQPGKNDLDGEWNLTVVDGDSVTATLTVSTSAGSVSATSSSPELAFAARQR